MTRTITVASAWHLNGVTTRFCVQRLSRCKQGMFLTPKGTCEMSCPDGYWASLGTNGIGGTCRDLGILVQWIFAKNMSRNMSFYDCCDSETKVQSVQKIVKSVGLKRCWAKLRWVWMPVVTTLAGGTVEPRGISVGFATLRMCTVCTNNTYLHARECKARCPDGNLTCHGCQKYHDVLPLPQPYRDLKLPDPSMDLRLVPPGRRDLQSRMCIMQAWLQSMFRPRRLFTNLDIKAPLWSCGVICWKCAKNWDINLGTDDKKGFSHPFSFTFWRDEQMKRATEVPMRPFAVSARMVYSFQLVDSVNRPVGNLTESIPKNDTWVNIFEWFISKSTSEGVLLSWLYSQIRSWRLLQFTWDWWCWRRLPTLCRELYQATWPWMSSSSCGWIYSTDGRGDVTQKIWKWGYTRSPPFSGFSRSVKYHTSSSRSSNSILLLLSWTFSVTLKISACGIFTIHPNPAQSIPATRQKTRCEWWDRCLECKSSKYLTHYNWCTEATAGIKSFCLWSGRYLGQVENNKLVKVYIGFKVSLNDMLNKHSVSRSTHAYFSEIHG